MDSRTRRIHSPAHLVTAAARGDEGGCVELEEGEWPYLSIVGALRDLDWDPDGEIAGSLPRGGRAELARVVPDLGPVAAAPSAPAGAAPYSPGRLHELLLLVLRGLSRMRPLLLVIEDLHWADRSTRDFVSYLARRLSPPPKERGIPHRQPTARAADEAASGWGAAGLRLARPCRARDGSSRRRELRRCA